MTQAVSNTLNNIEQMLLTQEKVQKVSDTVHSAMDKSNDFKKVFETKVEGKQSTVSDVKDIVKYTKSALNNDVEKDFSQKEQQTLIVADFKEILEKVTDEANVETSLDLTLARDINEIISQLKEAVEDVTELVDGDIENSEELEQAIPDVLPMDLTIFNESGFDTNAVDSAMEVVELETQPVELEMKSAELETQPVELEMKSAELEMKPVDLKATIYNQLSLNANTKESELNLDSKLLMQEEESNFFEGFEFTQDEVIELAENLSDEVVAQKTSNESTVNELEGLLEEEMVKDLKVESLSADVDASGSETFMQSQTPQEHAVKAIINSDAETFDIKLESRQNVQSMQMVQTKSVDTNPSRIIEQITKHLEGLQNNSKVNIVLNPESLGKVNIQLMNTKDGLTAQFTVTTQEARDMLTKGLDGLKESLGAHGVAVDNVSIKLADTQKSEYNQDWTEQEGSNGGNKGHKNPDREEKEKGLFEKMMAQVTDDENGNV